jgi:3-deoxy-D-manno-octulosonate 8-phosphate phosphatase (KDO 8-P phosphatase)
LKARKATPLERIELLILDVDGVLTDGRLYFGARGEALKAFHVRDGHGIKLVMAAGVAVAAFSGRRSGAVAARMKELRVPHVVQACNDKVAALHRLIGRLKIDPLNCACIVDDTPDLPLMSAVGMAGAVADAHPLVLSAAHWIARANGGRGAVRELCDAILRARAALS